jgi:hypothetical protein
MIQILLRPREELGVQDLGPRQIRFKGFQVVSQVIDCPVDIHGELYGCFKLLLVGKIDF